MKSNNIYDKIFHASSHLPSGTSSKDLKWGYKLNPKLFTGLHNTVISINRIKTPFWPLFHHSSGFSNPGLVHAIDNGASGFSNVHLNDDNDLAVNKTGTVELDVGNSSLVRLDDFPSFGLNNYQIKVPVTVAQNSKNFVFRIGNWLYVGKNKNDVFVQQQGGYFRK